MPVVLFSPGRLICREQKGSLLCLPAARDSADQGRSMGSGTLAMALLGGLWVAKGKTACGAGDSHRVPKAAGKWAVLLAVVVDLSGSPPASKRSSRGAGLRGKGSALIKLTVLLMPPWTQPLSFSLPAATWIIRCRGRGGSVSAGLLTVLLAVFRWETGGVMDGHDAKIYSDQCSGKAGRLSRSVPD